MKVLIKGQEVDYAAAVNLMDDGLREQLHAELAPCTNQIFVDKYIDAHKKKHSEDFEVS